MTAGILSNPLLFGALVAGLVISGCSRKEDILPGQRFDLREIGEARSSVENYTPQDFARVQGTEVPQPADRQPNLPYTVSGQAQRISLPGQRANSDWAQSGGSAQHVISHPALGAQLTHAWSADIGQGDAKRIRLTADPVVAGGRIFTLDALSSLRAFSINGQLLWERNLTPASERRGEATGGGLAVSGNRLFVTTGYGELHAISPSSGGEYWVQDIGANPSSGPTVSGGIVYVSGRDGQGWALDEGNGRVLWRVESGSTGAVTTAGASPAIAGRAVVFPFGSGEVVSTLKQGGVRLWSTTVTGQRQGRAYAGISDIAGDPVVEGNRIYVANPAGRLAALDATSGERIWTAKEGASSPVWPVGGSVFLISDENDLVRLSASTGQTIWTASLPYYTDERVRKRSGIFAHYGPVLAGGRLIVVSNDGYLRQIDPASGQLVGATKLPAPAAANPIVAGRTLYVVTTDGALHAFR